MPWQERLSIGTWHGSEPCGADAGMVTPQELGSFIDEINEAFPSLRLGARRHHAGAARHRARKSDAAQVSLADRPIDPRAPSGRRRRRDHGDGREVHDRTRRGGICRHAGDGADGAQRDAADLTAAPAGQPFPIAPRRRRSTFDREAWEYLQRIYGADAERVAATAIAIRGLAERITPSLPIVGAQIVEAARNEMALTLEDVVLRRTGLGAAGYPGDEACLKVERLMRDELGWTSARVRGRDPAAQGVLPADPRVTGNLGNPRNDTAYRECRRW